MVIAVIAVLAVVLVLTLNPADLLKQARDSNRLSDLDTLNKALSIYSLDTGGSLGTASTTYISIPDQQATSTQGDQCQGLVGLPSLPAGWSYHCAASSTYRNTDGTGWIPLNFKSVSSGSPIGTLAIDPINTTSSGNYYMYISGGSWEITAIPESQKYRANFQAKPNIPQYPGVIAVGSDLTLSPLFSTNGLVGYWTFDEGSGSTAIDSSGNNNNGNLSAIGATWTSGKVGGAISFDGSAGFVSVPTSPTIPSSASNETLTMWIKSSNCSYAFTIATSQWSRRFGTFIDGLLNYYRPSVGNACDGNWHLVAYTINQTSLVVYTDANMISQTTMASNIMMDSGAIYFGKSCAGTSCNNYFSGILDDIRYYNRALSAAEIQAIYNATK